MLLATGDTHGSIDMAKLNKQNFPEQKKLTKNDHVLIAGDFGHIWYPPGHLNEREQNYYLNDYFPSRKYTTLFIDGNHCISKDSDILTEKGWMNIVDTYNSDYKIANFDINTKEIFFDYPIRKIKSFKEKAIYINSYNIQQLVSYDHDIVINGKKEKAANLIGKDIREYSFIHNGNANNEDIDISDNDIKLLTWTIMDGAIWDENKKNKNSKKCRIQFKFVKQRKIVALQELLAEMNIKFSTIKQKYCNKDGEHAYVICFHSDKARYVNELLNKVKRIPDNWRNFSKRQLEIFLDCLKITDGCYIDKSPNKNIKWLTTDKHNADIIQEACIKNDMFFTIKSQDNSRGFSKGRSRLQYRCTIFIKDKRLDTRVKIESLDYNDNMYCFTMPKGTLISRYNNISAFTGNCNFDLLNNYQDEIWNGGKIHRINDSIIHLKRGQVFEIDGLKVFTMGGAKSIDKAYRKPYISWWPDEEPSNEELEEGLANLEKHNWEVDIVVTHTVSERVLDNLIRTGAMKYPENLNKYFTMLENKLKYKKWFFGHFHTDTVIDDKTIGLYNEIYNVSEDKYLKSFK